MNYDMQFIKQRYSACEGALCIDPSANQCASSFYRSPRAKPLNELYSNCVFDGSSTFWAVKFSFDYFKTFENCKFIGGQKGIIEICRGGDIVFKNCKFISNQCKTPVSIKAGAKNVRFESCIFESEKRSFLNFWLYIGMWSVMDFFDRPFTRGIVLSDCKFIKGPVLISTVAFAEIVKFNRVKNRSINVPKWIVKKYWALKRWVYKKKKINVPSILKKVYPEEL